MKLQRPSRSWPDRVAEIPPAYAGGLIARPLEERAPVARTHPRKVNGVEKLCCVWVLGISLFGLAGCARQQLLTGEPVLYGINNTTGQVVDRDLATDSTLVHKGEIITLMVNSVFLKFVQDIGNPHVLVYAEVHDDGTDNPETALRRVIYNGENTPQGVNLGVSDRVVYGPAPFRGFPLRVKLFIVELDKEQKKQASQLINAAGSLAMAAAPQYATAVGVAVELAQALNALNEDDFELRSDLTFYPIAPTLRYSVANAALEGLERPEPVQRQGKMIHLATPLRSGSYLVIKRELPRRVRDTTRHAEATTVFDFAQEAFLRQYDRTDQPGQWVTATEILRYDGGYLYREIAELADQEGDGLPNALVTDPQNPHLETALVPGIRMPYQDRTYLTLTLVTGLPEGLNDEALRATSDRSLTEIRDLLDNPDRLPPSERVGPYLDRLVSSVVATIEHRRLANQAARRQGADAGFRAGTDYPLFWAQNLERLEPGQEDTWREFTAKNGAILATLSEIVLNLPPVKPDNGKAITCLRSLEPADFEGAPDRLGLFNLSTEGLSKLKQCLE